MPQHTPGPWIFRVWATSDEDVKLALEHGLKPVRLLNNDGSTPVTGPDGPIAIVACQTKYKRGDGYKTECAQRDANARLIAEAPAMLEALKFAAAIIGHPDDSGSKLIAEVIARASCANGE